MSLDEEKEKARQKFVKTGLGRRQDHGSKGNGGGKGSDHSEWMVSSNRRRDARHGAEEELLIETVKEIE